MSTFLKRFGWSIGGLVGLILILLIGLYVVGSVRAGRSVAVMPVLSEVSATPAMRARGEHLANILACRECHGNDLSGHFFADAPPFRAVASNLTAGAGGIGQTYTVADWDRAIRHGDAVTERYGRCPQPCTRGSGFPSSLHSTGTYGPSERIERI